MTLRLPPGHHLMRLTARTAANTGDAGGSATVDRPVATDAWRGLPYLPASSLKGVLAGRLGNVELASRGPAAGPLNRRRTELFGAPDDDDAATAGRAGRVVLGDGEPLSFPLLLADGRRARVVVAETLFRLAHLGFVPGAGLQRVEWEEGYEGPLGAGDFPPLPLRLRPARFGIPPTRVERLAGGQDGAVPVLAAPAAAEALWRAALEERTLTALGSDRTVRQGSLRRVELIPPGTVFLSLVSHLKATGAADLGPAAPLQLGAWESVGHGYFAAEVLGDLSDCADDAQLGSPAATATAPGAAAPPREPWEVMTEVYSQIAALRGRPEAPRVRSAVFDLGPRLRRWGLPATLAFCLAKAAPAGDGGELPPERLAYRWLLAQLFALPSGSDHATLHRRVRRAVTGEDPAQAELETTALWLRRYAEILLPPERRNG